MKLMAASSHQPQQQEQAHIEYHRRRAAFQSELEEARLSVQKAACQSDTDVMCY